MKTSKRRIVCAVILVAVLLSFGASAFAASLEIPSSLITGILDNYQGVYCEHCFPWDELIPSALTEYIGGLLQMDATEDITFRDVYDVLREQYGESEYFIEFENNIYTDCDECTTCKEGKCTCCEKPIDVTESLLMRLVAYIRTLIALIVSRLGELNIEL